MTSTVLPVASASWDEPGGVAPRGTVVVLTGRGETAAAYARFGRRIASDAYRVRVVEVDLDDLDGTRTRIEEHLDGDVPAPRVLVGADAGATLAALLLDTVAVDAAVLAGLALPGATGSWAGSWEDELEARTACPTHRRVISTDDVVERGALARALPAQWRGSTLTAPRKPVLVVHGSADPVTTAAEAFAPFLDADQAQVELVVGGRHDVLNDVTHRSVAATVVLFLERLKLGHERPVIVEHIH